MRLLSVSIAETSTLGEHDTPTGIVKRPVQGAVEITDMGLAGDAQADRRVHGGLDKAVYQFASETYQTLKQALPHLKDKFSQPPGVGENFSSSGMSDDTVYIGDIYRVGDALLQVSQPRMPCWKLNQHVGNAHMANLLMTLNQTGWYYRVLETGWVQAGDRFELTERIQQDFSVAGVWARWIELRQNRSSHGPLVPIPGLSTQWRFDWG